MTVSNRFLRLLLGTLGTSSVPLEERLGSETKIVRLDTARSSRRCSHEKWDCLVEIMRDPGQVDVDRDTHWQCQLDLKPKEIVVFNGDDHFYILNHPL